jgi:hypothetical protein
MQVLRFFPSGIAAELFSRKKAKKMLARCANFTVAYPKLAFDYSMKNIEKLGRSLQRTRTHT